MSVWICRTSLIWLPIVWSGDSDVIGSWKILPMRRPRSDLISWPSRGISRMSAVLPGVSGSENRMRPRTWAVLGKYAHDGLADDRFAGTGFADKRGHLAWQDAKIGAPDRMNRPADDGEGYAKIFDPQQISA